jgi:hypothetical protein
MAETPIALSKLILLLEQMEKEDMIQLYVNGLKDVAILYERCYAKYLLEARKKSHKLEKKSKATTTTPTTTPTTPTATAKTTI